MSFKFGDKDVVLKNRRAFFNKIGVDINNTALMWVVHGNRVVPAESRWLGVSVLDPDQAPRVDGLITDKPDISLSLLVADCLPVVLYDRNKRALGLIHVGWRGADQDIMKKAIATMREKYGSDPSELDIVLGPCILADSYLFENVVQKQDPKWSEFIKETDEGLYSVDLVGYVRRQLMESEVREDKVIESRIDTASDRRFYSHYSFERSLRQVNGRFLCVVGMS